MLARVICIQSRARAAIVNALCIQERNLSASIQSGLPAIE